MVRLFVRHSVVDYDDWKRGYDAFEAHRRDLGVRADAVFHGIDDRRDVTIWHDFDDLETAESFLESDDLREAMAEAGVVGQPTVWFVRRELVD